MEEVKIKCHLHNIFNTTNFPSDVTYLPIQRIVRKVFQEAFPFTKPNGGLGLKPEVYLSGEEWSTQPSLVRLIRGVTNTTEPAPRCHQRCLAIGYIQLGISISTFSSETSSFVQCAWLGERLPYVRTFFGNRNHMARLI
jgi:hypothetical protein